MIEKWEKEEDWDKLENWCDRVKEELLNYTTDKLYAGAFQTNLSMDKFTDDLSVIVEDSKLKIELDENLYETSDVRDENIKVIKHFVEELLPYYKFEKETEPEDAEHGFRLIFTLKEVEN